MSLGIDYRRIGIAGIGVLGAQHKSSLYVAVSFDDWPRLNLNEQNAECFLVIEDDDRSVG